MSRSLRRLGAALALLLVATSCSSSDDEGADDGTGVPPPPPEHMEPVDAGPMGEVLHVEELDGSGVGGQVWRVLYRSESLAGDPIGVTGIIARPDGRAPDGGFPILSYAHGTSGVADACAPSRQGAGGVLGLEQMLAAGYVVAATDYEGLGTPGVHPYLVSRSEGRSVLDAARAARGLVDDTSDRLVLLGGSQGGHAALAAASLAEGRTGELELVGTIAVAPAADVEAIANVSFADGVAFGFAAMIAAGWSGHYPGLSPDDVLAPAGVGLAERAAEGLCVAELFGAVQETTGPLVATPPNQVPSWHAQMVDNSIRADAVAGPVLLVQGSADEIIAQALSDQLHVELCAAGVPVRYQVYEGDDHGSVALTAFDDIVAWARARLEGRPPDITC